MKQKKELKKYLFNLLFICLGLIFIASCSTSVINNSSNTQVNTIDEYINTYENTQDFINIINTSSGTPYQVDFAKIVNEIQTIHAFPYKTITKDEFNNFALDLYNQIGKIDMKSRDKDYQYYFTASKIIPKIDDGHAHLRSGIINNNFTLPVEFSWFEDGLYIISTTDEYEKMLNKKILKINNIDIYEIKSIIDEYISADNKYSKKLKNVSYLRNQIVLEHLGLLDENSNALIEYKDNDEVKTILLPTGMFVTKAYKLSAIGRNEFTTKDPFKYALFKMVPEYNAMYLQWNRFISAQLLNTGVDLREMFKEMFTEIKENNLKHLIIDVRDNPGGFLPIACQFLSYIKNENKNHLYLCEWWYKPSEQFYFRSYGEDPDIYREEIKKGENIKCFSEYTDLVNLPELGMFYDPNSWFYMPYPDEELQFDGELYVLIDNQSFSMASWFAILIKDNEYGTIIGEPTGTSSISHPAGVYLPHKETLTTLFLPGIVLIRSNKEALKKEPDGVYPDVYLPTTFEDYLNGVDPCWDYLVKNVFKKN